MEVHGALARSYLELWGNSVRRLFGEGVVPLVGPEPSDNRFKDPEWSSDPYFDFCKQAYLLTTQWAEDILLQTKGLDEATRRKADWYFRQILARFRRQTSRLRTPRSCARRLPPMPRTSCRA